MSRGRRRALGGVGVVVAADVFFAGVNGASTADSGVNGVLDSADDVARVAAYLQQEAAHRF